MKKIYLLFVLLSLPGLMVAETQVSISSSASLATIGDQVNLKIIAKTNEDIDDIRISTGQKDFAVITDPEILKREEKDYTVFEKNMTIAFFALGDFEIKPFTVEFLKDDRVVDSRPTNSVPITVKSVLTDEDKDIKPLKDPIDLGGNPFFVLKYVFIVLVLVALVLFILYYIKKRRAMPREVAAPPLPPLEEYVQAVDKLWAQKLFDKGRFIEFFVILTGITKNYLNRNYRFNAEDLTTYETLYILKGKEKESLIQENMRYLFDVSDLVKFAKFIPDPALYGELQGKVREMIDFYKKREAAEKAASEEKKDAPLRQ